MSYYLLLCSLTLLTISVTLSTGQAYTTASSKKLPNKPSPAPGTQNPQQNMPFSATANGEMVSNFSGISFKVLTLAADIMNKTLYLAANAANVSMDRVLAPWVAISGIRFSTWYPLGGANVPIPIQQFFLWPAVETIAENVGLATVNSFDPLCADDEAGYLPGADYMGDLHHGFNNDPAMKKTMDLGLWLKFMNSQIISHRFLFPINEWTTEMEQSLRVIYRYIDVDNWHYIDLYSRNCLSRGQRDDGARVKN